MRKFVLALAAICFLAVPARAGSLTLDGPLEQGGLVHGKVDPGARVSLDGKNAAGRARREFHLRLRPRRARPSRARHRSIATAARSIAISPSRRGNTTPATSPACRRSRFHPAPSCSNASNAKTARRRRRGTSTAICFSSRPAFIWPVTGPISGVYGSQTILNGQPRAPHMGVDIAAPPGTPIQAPAAGIVTLAEKGFFMTGGTVMIDHGYGLSTVYFHMSRLDVKLGQKVAQGAGHRRGGRHRPRHRPASPLGLELVSAAARPGAGGGADAGPARLTTRRTRSGQTAQTAFSRCIDHSAPPVSHCRPFKTWSRRRSSACSSRHSTSTGKDSILHPPCRGQPDPILFRGQQGRARRPRPHHQRLQFGFAVTVMVGEGVAGENARAGFLGAAEEFFGLPDAGEGDERPAGEFAGLRPALTARAAPSCRPDCWRCRPRSSPITTTASARASPRAASSRNGPAGNTRPLPKP